MKQINQSGSTGFQKVIFDQIDSTYVGGVHINATEAAKRFKDGVIPGGTLLVPHTNGTFKPLNAALTAENVAGAIGLTSTDVPLDDFPTVAVVQAGTVRIDALPELEKAGIAFIKTVLPRLSAY